MTEEAGSQGKPRAGEEEHMHRFNSSGRECFPITEGVLWQKEGSGIYGFVVKR